MKSIAAERSYRELDFKRVASFGRISVSHTAEYLPDDAGNGRESIQRRTVLNEGSHRNEQQDASGYEPAAPISYSITACIIDQTMR